MEPKDASIKAETDKLIEAIQELNKSLESTNILLRDIKNVVEDIDRKSENKNYRSSRYLGPCG